MQLRHIVTVIGAMALVTHAIAAAPPPHFKVVMLGMLPGDVFSVARGVNLAQHAVGNSDKLTRRAFIWDAIHGMRDLGRLPGGTLSIAYSINNHDVVVGYADTPTGNQAFIWDQVNGMRSLGTLPGGRNSYAFAINDLGQVAGYSDGNFGERAFIWDAVNGMRSLGTLPGDLESQGWGINALGQVIGRSSLGADTRAFISDATGALHSLGDVPGGDGIRVVPNDVNDDGQVVGQSGGTSVPFIWDVTTGMHQLALLPTFTGGAATALNSGDLIAGYMRDFGGDSISALWVAGTPYDLDALILTPGLHIQPPSHITSTRVIASYGCTPPPLACQAILLLPDASDAASVPLLPGAWLGLLSLALLTLAVCRLNSRVN